MPPNPTTKDWAWLSPAAAICAVLIPLLLIWTFSIHVPGDRCSFASPNRPGLSERETLWALALSATLVGVGISILGLRQRRWLWGFTLMGFLGALVIVLIAALGLDPCGLS